MPSNEAIEALRLLNEYQGNVNALNRRVKMLKAQLFNIWWTYTCDRQRGDDAAQSIRKQAASQTKQAISDAQGAIRDAQGGVTTMISHPAINGELKQGAEVPFYLQRDPTLFMAGLQNAWPANVDGSDNLVIRTTNNTKAVTGSHQPTYVTNRTSHNRLTDKLPAEIVAPTETIFTESCMNWTDDQYITDHDVYYKNGDRFTGDNGWFPLLIEWEAEFYNVPFENWDFSEAATSGVVGYHLKQGVDITNSAIKGDIRKISGRCLIIPQASSILATTLQQAFDRIGAANLPISQDQQSEVTKSAQELDTVSTPLSGFTDQLITQMQGTHQTPVVSDQNGRAQFVSDDAKQISTELGLQAVDLRIDSTGVETTPFANLAPIPADPSVYSRFKPLTHEQFRFTKFNIIDKFGQIVQGIRNTCDPYNSIGPMPMPLFPCLGAAYSVDTVNDGGLDKARVVIPRQDQLCEFVQLPPSINQEARINADFVVNYFTVRGWLVLNYANASLQIFAGDGVFIGEYPALNGTPVSKPFATDNLINTTDPFLASLLKNFDRPRFLQNLFTSLSATVTSIQANPSSYSESMLSMFGRPLALVAFGTSLELADPPLTNQCTIAPDNPNVPSPKVTDYSFPLKIGDKDNVFDGLYGFFPNQPSGKYTPPVPYVSPDTSQFYTYHPSPSASNVTHYPIAPASTMLKPFHADPTANYAMSLQRLSAATIFSAIVDPFTPVHLYSALLPIKTLTIPRFAVDGGLSNIAAFFRTGPILLDQPLPPYDEGRRVKEDYRLDDAAKAPTANGTIAMPGVSMGQWAWLQPYKDGHGETVYNAMDVVQPDSTTKPMWRSGPYVATEGFLQQKVPFQPPASTSS